MIKAAAEESSGCRYLALRRNNNNKDNGCNTRGNNKTLQPHDLPPVIKPTFLAAAEESSGCRYLALRRNNNNKDYGRNTRRNNKTLQPHDLPPVIKPTFLAAAEESSGCRYLALMSNNNNKDYGRNTRRNNKALQLHDLPPVIKPSFLTAEESSGCRYLTLRNNNKDYGRNTRGNNKALQLHDLPPVIKPSFLAAEESSGCRYLALRNNNDYGRNTRGNNKALQLHDLPPDILDNILSRLSFKEAACTSVLSNGCRPIWRSCSIDLIFNKDTMCCPTHKREDFIRNVDSVLCQLSPTTPRDKFVLEFELINSDVQRHVDIWVAFCAASRAKHIVFDFNPGASGYRHGNSFSFPLHHFSNGAPVVTSLCLMFAYLNPQPLLPGFCGFTNLRKLKLDSIFGDIRPLLLPACAVLEWLSIVRCRLHSFTTSQPLCRLQYLCVQCCIEVHKLEVQAPNLATFIFTSFDNNPVPFMLDGCLAIQEVTVMVHTMNDLFDYAFAEHGFTHVPKLSIELPIDSKVVEFAQCPSKFVNLTHLILTVNVHVCCASTKGLLRLACLLELAPVLEQLELHMDCHRGVGETNLVPPEELPRAYRPHGYLKTVEMTGVYSFNNLLTLALYYARNAVALERMVIDPMIKRSFALTRDKEAAREIAMGRLLARKHLLGRGLDDILTIL